MCEKCLICEYYGLYNIDQVVRDNLFTGVWLDL